LRRRDPVVEHDAFLPEHLHPKSKGYETLPLNLLQNVAPLNFGEHD